MIILITGASGFVGEHLLAHLAPRRWELRLTRRGGIAKAPPEDGATTCPVTGDLRDIQANQAQWMSALEGASVVIHLAAVAHVAAEGKQTTELIHKVNAEAPHTLARFAAKAGVRRFIFLSSVKALGERTAPGRPFDELSQPAPEDSYGRAKLEAESFIHRVGAETGMETVIVRPPLVYGQNVGMNMAALINAVKKRAPLPFASVANQRSLVYAGNLASAIVECVENNAAAGQTFMVSDGADLSTPELVRAIGRAMNVAPRLIPAPLWALRAAGLAGDALGHIPGFRAPVNSGMIRRLTESLAVNSGKIRRTLGWKPPYSLEEGLRQTVAGFTTER